MDKDKLESFNTSAEAGLISASANNPRDVYIDYARYEHLLENSDLTEDQKQEFLGVLWNLVVNFVDLGFGVHPMQQALDECDVGACEKNAELSKAIADIVVDSDIHKKEEV